MKIYIGTIIEKYSNGRMFIESHVSGEHFGLALLIDDSLTRVEEESGFKFKRDINEIIKACENGNQHREPLTICEGAGLPFKIILSTIVRDI